jgi:hypothetical protein
VNAERSELAAPEDPQGQLERAFIDEFLRLRGYDRVSLKLLPEQEVMLLMKQASVYASGKLTEVESRAHFVHEIHGRPDDIHKPPRK